MKTASWALIAVDVKNVHAAQNVLPDDLRRQRFRESIGPTLEEKLGGIESISYRVVVAVEFAEPAEFKSVELESMLHKHPGPYLRALERVPLVRRCFGLIEVVLVPGYSLRLAVVIDDDLEVAEQRIDGKRAQSGELVDEGEFSFGRRDFSNESRVVGSDRLSLDLGQLKRFCRKVDIRPYVMMAERDLRVC